MNNWEQVLQVIERISEILFQISPTLISQQNKNYLDVLSSTLVKFFFNTYCDFKNDSNCENISNQIIPNFFEIILNIEQPQLISAFFEELASQLTEKDLFKELSEKMEKDGNYELVMNFFEQQVSEGNNVFLLGLKSCLTFLNYINLNPCYTNIILNIRTFTDIELQNAIKILQMVIEQIQPRDSTLSFISETGLIPLVAELSLNSQIENPVTLSLLGSIATVIERKCMTTNTSFVQASHITEQTSKYDLDISPLCEVANAFFISHQNIVTESAIPLIKDISHSSYEIIPQELSILFDRLCFDCSQTRYSTQTTEQILGLAEYLLRTLKTNSPDDVNSFFETYASNIPQDESVFPFAATLFKLLYCAKTIFAHVPCAISIVSEFSEILIMDPPLSIPQVNALLSYEKYFKSSYKSFNQESLQLALDALLNHIAENEDVESNEELSKMIFSILKEKDFREKITINETALVELSRSGNEKYIEISAEYINYKFNIQEYQEMVGALIEDRTFETADDINLVLLFFKTAKYHPEAVQINLEILSAICQNVSENDIFLAQAIDAGRICLGDSIQELIEPIHPCGFNSFKEYCRCLINCSNEYTANAIPELAPILEECLNEVSDWGATKSDEYLIAVEFHKVFFTAASKCSRFPAVQEAAFAIASNIYTRYSCASLVQDIISFAKNIEPNNFFLQLACTFAKSSSFAPLDNWRLVMNLAYEYIKRCASTSPEIYQQVISEMGEFGELLHQAIVEEKDEATSKKNYEITLQRIHYS